MILNIETRRLGSPLPHTIILTISTDDTEIEIDVVNLNGIADKHLIEQLRNVLDELEEHNAKIEAANPKPETTEEKVISNTLQRIEEMERQGYSPFRINEEIINHQP